MKKFQEENFYFSLFSENPLRLQFSIGFGRAKSQEGTEMKNYGIANFMKATTAEPLRNKTNNKYCNTARRFDEMRKDAIKAEISNIEFSISRI